MITLVKFPIKGSIQLLINSFSSSQFMPGEMFGYIVVLRAQMFRSLIQVLIRGQIKERNICARKYFFDEKLSNQKSDAGRY